MKGGESILEVRNLHTIFEVGGEIIPIVKGVSFSARRGRTLAIVGESGCGKSVTVHSVMRLLPKGGRVTAGELLFHDGDSIRDFRKLPAFGPQMRSIRGRKIGMVFQDPMASLNPVYRVGDQVAENLLEHGKMRRAEANRKIVEMFEILGIPDPERRIRDYPHQFSGGMKQRVMIAIAMICDPDLLIADEPTTALDVTIQAQIMELMDGLKRKRNTAILLITHNMGLVAESADDVAVMYMGRIVEQGSVEQIFGHPGHPYTQALLRSVPIPGRKSEARLVTIRGSTPAPSECGPGCEFANRCDFVSDACLSGPVADRETEGGHFVRCVLAGGKTDLASLAPKGGTR